MKIAATISGLPRFTKDFDLFLENISDYDQIDWFFYMWNDFEENLGYIPPWMKNPNNWNEDSVRRKIESLLPDKHNIVYLKIVDHPAYTEKESLNLSPWSNAPNIWFMHHGHKMVNQARLDYEKQHGPYDMIMRARTDVEIYPKINLRSCCEFIQNHPKNLITPANFRYGLQGKGISESFCLGSGETIDIYSQLVDKLFEYNDQGVIYHPETLSAHHMYLNKIDLPMTNFQIRFRHYKMPDGTQDFGRWN